MIKNRSLKNYLTLLIVFSLTTFFAVSCSDNVGPTPTDPPQQGVTMVKDLNASTGNRGKAGKYTFYSLENNAQVAESDSATTKWDIAFSGRTIIVNGSKSGPGNGGALVLDVPFNKVQTPPQTGYNDTSLKYTEWANYTGQTDPKHAFLPKENTTIVVRTADGSHVAKIKVISWYKGNPDPNSPEFADPYSRNPGYFTFKYKFMK